MVGDNVHDTQNTLHACFLFVQSSQHNAYVGTTITWTLCRQPTDVSICRFRRRLRRTRFPRWLFGCPRGPNVIARVLRALQPVPLPVDCRDLAMAITIWSTAAPRRIQAVPSCGTKNCSNPSQAPEYFPHKFPNIAPHRAAASIIRMVGWCTQGRSSAEPCAEPAQGVKPQGVALGATLCFAQAGRPEAACPYVFQDYWCTR